MIILEKTGYILPSAERSRKENCLRENNPCITVRSTKLCDSSVSALLPHSMCHLSCCPLLHEELQEAAHRSSPLSEQPCTNPAQIILRREALQSSLPVFSLMGHPLPKHRSNYFTKISAISTCLFFLSKNKLVTLYKRNITHFGKKASIKQK